MSRPCGAAARRVRRQFALAVCLLATLLIVPPAGAPPATPMRIGGSAFDSLGSALPVGTRLHAFLDGVDYANASTVLDSSGAFTMLVSGNSVLQGVSDTPSIMEGPVQGEAVAFAAGDPTSLGWAEEFAGWQTGVVAVLDLHLAPPAANPAPLKIRGIVPRPGLGGNQYAYVCNPTSSSVDLGSFFLEVNRPGDYHGPAIALSGSIAPNSDARVDLGSASYLIPTGDALKLVYQNPGGPNAPAAGADVVVDRLEYNGTAGGTLSWEPGNTILGDAPAPRTGFILERAVACVDTDSPGDFRLAREPDLANRTNDPPVVDLVSPTAGSTVPAGTPLRIEWTMSDDIFSASALFVWVNVTYPGTNLTLVAGAEGVTSVTWSVPSAALEDVVVTVDVEDPYSGHASDASGPFSIRGPDPFGGLLVPVGLALAVLLAIVVIVLYRRSKREAPPPPATKPASGPSTAPSPAPTQAPSRVKFCPRCGTSVQPGDVTCFFCGHRFESPP